MDPKRHWQNIYTSKRVNEVSWYQAEPRLSLNLIRRYTPDVHTVIADVGGGASTLVDVLLAAGYKNVTVLDISSAALAQARKRLGIAASNVRLLEADALDPVLPEAGIDFWHDRAVFHFLTDAHDRVRYVEQVRRALRPGGYVLIATFAKDGPQRCSGLDVMRYNEAELQIQFGEDFDLTSGEREDHTTPAGVHQAFQYCLFRYMPRTAGQSTG